MKRILYAMAVLAAAVLMLPQIGSADNPVYVICNTTVASPFIVTNSGTASASASNFVTIRGNLSRRWFNNTGFATNDILAQGQPPYTFSLAIFCNGQPIPFVVGPVTRSGTGTNLLSIACPLNQAGTTSQHLAFAD